MIFWRALANKEADGYSYASKNISSRLKAIGVLSLEDISRLDSRISNLVVDIDSGIRLIPEPSGTKILINNCLPPEYSFDGEYVIGFTYWETTRLPSSWVNYMNRCDEVWTTSSWAKQCFIDSGVRVPVYSFELGVDVDIFTKSDKQEYSINELGRPSRKPFTFLHIGSPSTRKNTQLAFNAYQKLFKNNPDYRLIVKSNGPPDARRYSGEEIAGPLYGMDYVRVIEQFLTDEELSELFDSVDCFIYPTRGEGWGMAPFQAIAKGVPTICTNATACTEFAHLSIPLEADMSSDNLFGIYQTGEWADPKIDDLCDKMLYVVNNYDEAVKKTALGSDYIHANYSWDNVVSKYKDRILLLRDKYVKY